MSIQSKQNKVSETTELMKHTIQLNFFNRITINYLDQIIDRVKLDFFGPNTVIVPFETDIGKEGNEILAISVSISAWIINKKEQIDGLLTH